MRVRGKLPWSYDCNRPYIRSLRGLCSVYQRGARYDEVLNTCMRLVKEAGDVENAAAFRSVAFLCRGQWMLAADAAAGLREMDPTMSFVHAFAHAEQGDALEAGTSAVHAMLNHPRAADMLLLRRVAQPRSRLEVSEHNACVWLVRMVRPYLTSHREGLNLLKRVRQQPEVAAAAKAILESEKKWEDGNAAALAGVNAERSLENARRMLERFEASQRGILPMQVTVKGRADA